MFCSLIQQITFTFSCKLIFFIIFRIIAMRDWFIVKKMIYRCPVIFAEIIANFFLTLHVFFPHLEHTFAYHQILDFPDP